MVSVLSQELGSAAAVSQAVSSCLTGWEGRPGSSGQFSPVSQISVVVSFVDANYCPLVGALGLEDGFGSSNFG